jgi:hypothetical protein
MSGTGSRGTVLRSEVVQSMLPRDHDGCQSAWTGDARFVRVARGLGTLSILLGLAAVVSWAIMVIAVMSLGGARLASRGATG